MLLRKMVRDIRYRKKKRTITIKMIVHFFFIYMHKKELEIYCVFEYYWQIFYCY